MYSRDMPMLSILRLFFAFLFLLIVVREWFGSIALVVGLTDLFGSANSSYLQPHVLFIASIFVTLHVIFWWLSYKFARALWRPSIAQETETKVDRFFSFPKLAISAIIVAIVVLATNVFNLRDYYSNNNRSVQWVIQRLTTNNR
jgi:hypothetical protein